MSDGEERQVFRDAITNLSSHGLQRIFYPVSPTATAKYFRFIWFVAWSLAAYYMFHQMTNTIRDYLDYKTVTKVTIEQNDRVPFPAVTVCSGNPLRMSLVREWLKNCNEEKDGEAYSSCARYASELEEIDRSFNQSDVKIQRFLLGAHSVIIEKIQFRNNWGNMTLSDLIKNKLFVQDASTDQKENEELFWKWNEFKERLQIFGRDLNVHLSQHHPNLAKDLSDVMIDFLVDGDDDMKFSGNLHDPISMARQWNFNFHMATPVGKPPCGGNCYTFNFHGTHHQNQPNLEGGLVIFLAKKALRWIEDCFETFPFQEMDGFCGKYLIAIHAPGTLPTMAHGEFPEIDESKSFSYEYEERHNLEAPYGNCKDEHPQELLDECEGMRPYKPSIKTCFAYKYNNDLPFCSSPVGSESTYPKKVECFPECHQHLYKMKADKGDHFEDFLRIEVYNKNLETKSVTQMKAVTFEQVVANAGGLVGLWLGASMLTVLELLELFTNLCHFSLKWFWTKKMKNKSVIKPVKF